MEFNPPTPSSHRLRLGLPGSLIPFTTLAVASECQKQTRRSPSPLVFLPISTHFTTTPGIPSSSSALKFGDRKSTRLNSSHSQISYAVFCLKKKTSPLADGESGQAIDLADLGAPRS